MGLNPQNIGIKMPHGYAGSFARQPDMIVNTHSAAGSIPFGAAVEYDAKGNVTAMGALSTAAKFVGVAVREVKSALNYLDQSAGAYAASEAVPVLMRGSVNVKCYSGTPVLGGKVYIRVAANAAMPNHILLPYEQYNYLLTTMVTDLATETILDFVLKNNAAAKNGRSLFIGATRWCKGVGTGGTDRMAVYVNHERFVQVEELAPLSRVMSQPNVSGFCYDTAYAANISEVELFYPQTMMYFDGI